MIPGSKGSNPTQACLPEGFLTLGLAKNMSKKVRIKESVGNMERIAQITRNTNETKINMTLNLDGSGKANIHTGIGFFDHMLNSFARHGFFDLDLTVDGDLEVDTHHTIDDTGIVLGQAIRKAVGDKKGICRYGSQILPMDEALVICARIFAEDLICV